MGTPEEMQKAMEVFRAVLTVPAKAACSREEASEHVDRLIDGGLPAAGRCSRRASR